MQYALILKKWSNLLINSFTTNTQNQEERVIVNFFKMMKIYIFSHRKNIDQNSKSYLEIEPS